MLFTAFRSFILENSRTELISKNMFMNFTTKITKATKLIDVNTLRALRVLRGLKILSCYPVNV